MKTKLTTLQVVGLLITVGLMGIACNLTKAQPSPGLEPLPELVVTTTPSPTPHTANLPEKSPETNRCESLRGSFDIQLLVGPADAVGLEPVAVGNIPFEIISSDGSYQLEGSKDIFYENVLAQEWGTYSVTFEMQLILSGTCQGEPGSETLSVEVMMSGDQMVEVDAGGFLQQYPWSGTHQNTLTFPLEEGAQASGEGWSLVLHLN